MGMAIQTVGRGEPGCTDRLAEARGPKAPAKKEKGGPGARPQHPGLQFQTSTGSLACEEALCARGRGGSQVLLAEGPWKLGPAGWSQPGEGTGPRSRAERSGAERMQESGLEWAEGKDTGEEAKEEGGLAGAVLSQVPRDNGIDSMRGDQAGGRACGRVERIMGNGDGQYK